MRDRPERLHVELHGVVVAYLHERRRDGRILLSYTDAALERWDARLPIVSCSLPLGPGAQDATAFLNGLLPEGQARATLAAHRDLPASDTWGLLAAFGRDVAGAMIVTDPDTDASLRRPRAIDYASVSELATAIASLPELPLGAHDDSELSLAGLQDKLLLVTTDAPTGWGRPVGGLPSTHILKPDPYAHPGVVVREAEALRLAKRVGLTTIEPQLVDIDGRRCLIVDRYDRDVAADGTVRRRHQEDVLQAAGLDPSARLGRAKYEEHGGPGFRDVAMLLLERAVDQDAELRRLVGALVFTVLIGNADAHAKNLSLLLDPPGTVRLAPLYDTVPTMLFTRLKVRCAMWIGGVHRSLEDVTWESMLREIAGRHAWRVPEQRAVHLLDEWVDAITAAADEATPTGAYVRRRAARLRRGG